jgi:hypothetical protein
VTGVPLTLKPGQRQTGFPSRTPALGGRGPGVTSLTRCRRIAGGGRLPNLSPDVGVRGVAPGDVGGRDDHICVPGRVDWHLVTDSRVVEPEGPPPVLGEMLIWKGGKLEILQSLMTQINYRALLAN